MRSAAVVCAAFTCGALWLATLAAESQIASAAIVDDPSARELEQVAALVKGALAMVLLCHAAAAALYTRRPFQLNAIALVVSAAVAATTITGSLSRAPILSTPGLVPASLLLTCGFIGYHHAHAWPSAYLGVALGSVGATVIGLAALDPFVVLAVSAPPVGFALVGVGVGRLAARLSPSGPAA